MFKLSTSLQQTLADTEALLYSQNILFFSSFFVFCASISLLTHYVVSIQNEKAMSWIKWVLEILIVLVTMSLIGSVFTGSVYLSNVISESIMPYSEFKSFFFDFFGNPTTTKERMFNGINLLRVDVFHMISMLFMYLALFAFHGLLLWRFLYMMVLSLLAHLHIIKSLIPNYGMKSIFSYVSEIIQVASWSIYFAAGNKVMKIVLDGLKDTQGDEPLDPIWKPVVSAMYVVFVLSIPKFAASHLGGTNLGDQLYKTASVFKDVVQTSILTGLGAKTIGSSVIKSLSSGGAKLGDAINASTDNSRNLKE